MGEKPNTPNSEVLIKGDLNEAARKTLVVIRYSSAESYYYQNLSFFSDAYK